MKRIDRLKDELLVLRAQADPREIDSLVKRWHEGMVRAATRMTRDEEAAWDLTQDTWCAVVRRLHTLEDSAAFPKWIYTILTNKCRDWGRKRTRRFSFLRRYQREIEHRPPPPAQPFASQSLEWALQQLDEQTRHLVALFYERELTVNEVADILRMKPGTVKSKLHRARAELRTILEREEKPRRNK